MWHKACASSKDFDEYLVPVEKFVALKLASALSAGCSHRLRSAPAWLELLEQQLAASQPCMAVVTIRRTPSSPLRLAWKITPLPDAAQVLTTKLPRSCHTLKITELLMEVDERDGLHPPLHAPEDRRHRKDKTC